MYLATAHYTRITLSIPDLHTFKAVKRHRSELPTRPELNADGDDVHRPTAATDNATRAFRRQDASGYRAFKQHQYLSQFFRFSLVDKAADRFAVMCNKWSKQRLNASLQSTAYQQIHDPLADVTAHINTACTQAGIPLQMAPRKNADGETVYDTPTLELPRMYLILKAHKTPISTRVICIGVNTQNANIAKTLVPALNLCLEAFNDLWVHVAQHFHFSALSSWIVQRSTDVIAKLQQVYREPQHHGTPLAILDFVDMYTKFDQKDMVRKLIEFAQLTFAYKRGEAVLTASDLLGPYSTLKSTADPRQSIKLQYSRSYKGQRAVRYAKWSDTDAATDTSADRLRLDEYNIGKLCEFLLTNTYVNVNDQIYRQTSGTPMGLPASQQFANAYTGMYERTLENTLLVVIDKTFCNVILIFCRHLCTVALTGHAPSLK